MRTRRAATITDLRRAVDCLPRATRIAMLDGIRSNAIIVGAYTGPDGICPMLAAHRAGARTDFISFAKAWDRFALTGSRGRRARRATRRELLVLTTQLEASLRGPGDVAVTDLGSAVTVRAWRDGDRMRPAGLGGSKSLQDLFTDRKVPRALRRTLPVVERDGEIVWVAGVAVDERFAVREGEPGAVALTAQLSRV